MPLSPKLTSSLSYHPCLEMEDSIQSCAAETCFEGSSFSALGCGHSIHAAGAAEGLTSEASAGFLVLLDQV